MPGGGWHLSHRRVPVPDVPRSDPERTMEIWHRRLFLPPDLRNDPAYAVSSMEWHNWNKHGTDARRITGFLRDGDFPFDQPPPTRRQAAPRPPRRSSPPRCDATPHAPLRARQQAPPQDDDAALVYAYHNEGARDDSEDFVAAIFYEWETDQAEGRDFQVSADMTEDEQERLATLISQVPQREPTPPRYAREVMLPGMSPEEALQQAIRNSAPTPRAPRRDPWAVMVLYGNGARKFDGGVESVLGNPKSKI